MTAVIAAIQNPAQWRVMLQLAQSPRPVAAATLATAADATGADLLALRMAGFLYAAVQDILLAGHDDLLDLAADVTVGLTRPGQAVAERVSVQNLALIYLRQRFGRRAPLEKVRRYSHTSDEELRELDELNLVDVYVGVTERVRALASIKPAEHPVTVLKVTDRGRRYATRTR